MILMPCRLAFIAREKLVADQFKWETVVKPLDRAITFLSAQPRYSLSLQPIKQLISYATRQDSYNKKLVKIASQAAQQAGVETTFIDFRDFPLPLFDEDLEKSEGFSPQCQELKELFIAHQGFLIASPEYNSHISGVLKNVIDWVSRPKEGEKSLQGFKGKVAGIMSASPGGLGGIRGLVSLRSILGNIGVIVLPDQVCIAKAYEAFQDNGSLKDTKQQKQVQNIGTQTAHLLLKLGSGL